MHDIRRVDFGYFVRPAAETETGQPRVEPALGYLVAQPDGWLLFDTGMGTGPPELEDHYRPVRQALPDAVRRAGVDVVEIRWVVNCHLHFDHCGGNPLLSGRPVFTQRTELAEASSTEHYTLPQLIDFRGAHYEQLDGEAEVLPGVWVIPTPGHTDGHQSLVVRREDGTVVVAGQAHDTATQYSAEQLAWRADRDGIGPPLPSYRPWLDRLMAFDPRRVVFAHDLAVWEPAAVPPNLTRDTASVARGVSALA